MPLGIAVHPQAWPTPATRDYRAPNALTYAERGGGTKGEQLNNAIAQWPTPMIGSKKGGGEFDSGPKTRETMSGLIGPEQVRAFSNGQLNPDWEEILMGWEIGWTDITRPCPMIFPGWPMGMGPDQHPYEPPRTIPQKSCPNRTARVKAIGNGVVWQCSFMAFSLLLSPPWRG